MLVVGRLAGSRLGTARFVVDGHLQNAPHMHVVSGIADRAAMVAAMTDDGTGGRGRGSTGLLSMIDRGVCVDGHKYS